MDLPYVMDTLFDLLNESENLDAVELEEKEAEGKFLVTYISSYAFGIASTVIAVLAVLVLLTSSVKNGMILFAIAFLVSPLGLPMLAVKLVGLLNRLGGALGDLART